MALNMLSGVLVLEAGETALQNQNSLKPLKSYKDIQLEIDRETVSTGAGLFLAALALKFSFDHRVRIGR
jgi:hypothetical protein